MELLLLHLLGDYVTQTDWMARNKATSAFAALVHAVVYTAPFMLLTTSVSALTIIAFTHFLIDHFRLARHLIFAKNWVTDWSLKWRDCQNTGYPDSMPHYLSFWLLIITDNTTHLIVNWVSIRYL